jgi:hypothetical protein
METLDLVYRYLTQGFSLLTSNSSAKAVEIKEGEYYIAWDFEEFVRRCRSSKRIFKCFKKKIKESWREKWCHRRLEAALMMCTAEEMGSREYEIGMVVEEIKQALAVIQVIIESYKVKVYNSEQILECLYYELNDDVLRMIQQVCESEHDTSIATIKRYFEIQLCRYFYSARLRSAVCSARCEKKDYTLLP